MKLIVCVFILSQSLLLAGQSLDKTSNRYRTILELVNSYNQEDYKEMKKCFSIFGRIIVSKKRLARQFQSFFDKNGSATIVDVTQTYGSIYTVQLKMEKNQRLRTFWQVNFNDEADVVGFGFGYPPLYYPINHNTAPKFKYSTLVQQLDSIIAHYIKQTPLLGFNGSLYATLDTFSYSRSAGYRYLKDSLPNNSNTRFLLASCTKPLTAFATLILVDHGALQLKDPVINYIVEFPYPEITVENLLCHTSGIPNYQSYLNKHLSKNSFITNEDVLKMYVDYSIECHFEPNQRFEYSNTNFIFLAILIERVSKKSFHEFLDMEIFRPLNMENTSVYNTRRYKSEILSNYAHGYVYMNNNQTYEIPDSIATYDYVIRQDRMYGDDNVSSTASDMSKFLSLFHGPNHVLSDSLIKKMTKQHQLTGGKKNNYGLGIMVLAAENYEKVLYHTGSWPGYYTLILTLPKHKINLVILTNNEYEYYLHLADDIIATLIQYEKLNSF